MKNLFALLGALVVTFVLVGWYLDWFKIQSGTDSSGHREVNIDFNTKKINEDISKGAERIEKVIEHKQPSTTPSDPTNPEGVTVRPNPIQPVETLILTGGKKQDPSR
jgi:hypothetical protein